MDGIGQFSKTLVCLGSLSGATLANNMQFKWRPDVGNFRFEVMVYTGNRVNLYVHNMIRSAQQVSPNSFGIRVGWSFSTFSYPNRSLPNPIWCIRNLDMGSLGTPPDDSPLADSEVMEDSKIEYAIDGSGNIDTQFGELGHNVYLFPKYIAAMPGSMERWHIIPVTARADFIRVYFYSDPANWVATDNDRVTIYALSGSDVAGSQRIGGGHG